jgi:carboxypeptidase C (cathepsin A)
MSRFYLRWFVGVLLSCAVIELAHAEVDANADAFRGHQFTTTHSGEFNGKSLEYTATFGETVIHNKQGEETASIYSTDYVANGIDDSAVRPVVFFWQGGPSAPASYIHINGFGPRRLATGGTAEEPEISDSKFTILDVADLVFVDPAGTGFSRVLPAGSKQEFFSTPGDAESMTLFVRDWLKARGRQSSPVYLAGTSYGSIRVARMAGWFVHHELPLSGLFLFSQGVNLVETTQRANNLVGYASNVSQLASVAWYHGKTARQEKPVFEVIDEAFEFAMGDYLVGIAKGNALPAARKQELARTLSELTGISEAFYIENDLIISKQQFRKELLKGQGLLVSGGDGRSTVPLDQSQQRSPVPANSPLLDYFRDELNVTLPFEQYVPYVGGPNGWDYAGSSTLTPDRKEVALGTLRDPFADYDYPGDVVASFKAYSDFRVFIATGIYDLLTTTGPARLLASHPDFPADRVEVHEYEGGHSFYGNDDEFERLTSDIRKFLENR